MKNIDFVRTDWQLCGFVYSVGIAGKTSGQNHANQNGKISGELAPTLPPFFFNYARDHISVYEMPTLFPESNEDGFPNGWLFFFPLEIGILLFREIKFGSISFKM